jgi:hypothetical protein
MEDRYVEIALDIFKGGQKRWRLKLQRLHPYYRAYVYFKNPQGVVVLLISLLQLELISPSWTQTGDTVVTVLAYNSTSHYRYTNENTGLILLKRATM